MFFRCSLSPSVSPPRPMDVKKLIAKRLFFGESRGNRPSTAAAMEGSLRRSLSLRRPWCSDISWQGGERGEGESRGERERERGAGREEG